MAKFGRAGKNSTETSQKSGPRVLQMARGAGFLKEFLLTLPELP